MTLEIVAIVVGAVSPLILMVVGWIFTRSIKQAEKVAALDVRLTAAEVRIHNHGGRLASTDEALADIRDHMVRKDDLDHMAAALTQRIDDVLGR